MSSRMNRRQFLKCGAVAGAVILASPGMATTYAQNKKLKIAYVATGGRGDGHLGCGKGENVTAICDVDLSRTNKAKQMFPQSDIK